MEFRGNYAFLSNMYSTPVEVYIKKEKYVFRNSEAAFQAHKNPSSAHMFETLNGVEAKRAGKKIQLAYTVDQWNIMRVYSMAKVIWCKFQNPSLYEKLKQVEEPIVEDNTWNDTYWGVCTNKKYDHKGKNILGRLLTGLKEYGTTQEGLNKLYDLCNKIVEEKY